MTFALLIDDVVQVAGHSQKPVHHKSTRDLWQWFVRAEETQQRLKIGHVGEASSEQILVKTFSAKMIENAALSICA